LGEKRGQTLNKHTHGIANTTRDYMDSNMHMHFFKSLCSMDKSLTYHVKHIDPQQYI